MASHKQKHVLPKYALVRWTSGEDEGKFNHDVPTAWIKDFTLDGDYQSESWIIEWRVPPKPMDGWVLCDGQVLAVNDDMTILRLLQMKEEKLQAMEDKISGADGVSGESAHDNVQPKSKGTPSRRKQEIVPRSPGTPQKENIPNVQAFFAQLMAAAQSTPGHNTSKSHSFSSPLVTEEGVRIGKSLQISRTCYHAASAARTPPLMTTILVRGAFSVKRLQKSTYAGQKREGRADKPSLNKYIKMEDIQNFVLSRFANFSQSNFSSAVNQCVGKKARNKKKVKLVEESEDEPDNDDDDGGMDSS